MNRVFLYLGPIYFLLMMKLRELIILLSLLVGSFQLHAQYTIEFKLTARPNPGGNTFDGDVVICNNSGVKPNNFSIDIKWPALTSLTGGELLGVQNGTGACDTWQLTPAAWNMPGANGCKTISVNGTYNDPFSFPAYGIASTGDTVKLLVTKTAYVPQSYNQGPSEFYFDPNCFIPSPSDICLGEAHIREWNEEADVRVPTNRKSWALAAAFSHRLFTNLVGQEITSINYAFAQSMIEGRMGCDQNFMPPSGDPNPLDYRAISVADGCFQISTTGFAQLYQLYPDVSAFDPGNYNSIISGDNFVTACASKAIYDYATMEYWDKIMCYKPLDFFNTTCDQYAAEEMLAYAYHDGLDIVSRTNPVFKTQRATYQSDCDIALTISKTQGSNNAVPAGYQYAERMRNNLMRLDNNLTSPGGPSLNGNYAKENWDPATDKYYGCYDQPFTIIDINDFIDALSPLYPTANISAIKAKALAAFNALGGGVVNYSKLGPVIDAIVLGFPAYNPDKGMGQTYGEGACPSPAISMSTCDKICPGQTGELWVQLMGTPPFSFVVQGPDGTLYSRSNVNKSTEYLKVNQPGTYKVISFSDANGAATLNCNMISATIQNAGNATVKWNKTAVVNGCASGDLKIDLTGTAPFVIDYKDATGATKTVTINSNVSPYTLIPATVPSGSYVLTHMTAGGCNSTLNDSIKFCSACTNPTAVLTGGLTICAGDSTELSVTLTGTAPWKLKLNDGTVKTYKTGILISPYKYWVKSTGIYTVDSVYDASCGAVGTGSANVTVKALPAIELGNDFALCSGATATLDAGAVFSSYSWTGVKTGNAKNILADAAGWYKLAVVDINGCKAKDSVQVSLGNAVTIDFGAATKTICTGTNIFLQPVIGGGDGSFTYQWSNAASGTMSSFTASNAGFYTLEVTDGKGCKVKDSVSVTLSSNLTVTLQNAGICSGDSMILNSGYSGAGYTFLWNTGETTSTVKVKNAGTYSVNVSNNGCNGNGSMNLSLYAAPIVNLGNDKNVCSVSTTILDAGVFSSYLWSSGENTQTVSKGAGSYYVTVTDNNGCKASDTIVVNSIAKPIPNTIIDVQTCSGNNVVFDESIFDNGNGPFTYKWDDNSTASTLTINNVISNSTHFVDVTDQYGCTGRDSAKVSVSSNLAVQIIANPDSMLCAGESLTLSSNYNSAGGYNLIWSTGATTDNITINTASSITLSVDDGNGCSGSDGINVLMNPSPNLNLIPLTSSVCSGDAALIGHDYGAGYSYLWTPGNLTSAIISTNIGGAYTVKVTDNSTGCFADTSVNVTLNNKPSVDLGSDIDNCVGKTLNIQDLSGQTGVTYQWSKASSGGSIISTSGVLQITSTDLYHLKVVDANNCYNTDSLSAVFKAMPVVNLLSGADSAWLCGNETLSLDAANSIMNPSYLWSPTKVSSRVITVNNTGDYSVIVSNGNCKDTDQVHVVSVVLPEGVLNDVLAPVKSYYCFEEEKNGVTLSALGIDGITYNYLWNTNATSSSIVITKEGTYSVTISKDACEVTDVVAIGSYCPSSLYIPNSFTPNGDGKNAVFKAEGINVSEFELLIFDRWGELIFKSNDIDKGWDGTYIGKKVQEDVYVWKLSYNTNLETGKKQRNERIGVVTPIF